MREIHAHLPDSAGRKLERMADVEGRTLSGQIKVAVENEWKFGGYDDADDDKRDDAA